jgi:tRNA (guanine37-N1)-methyltransferase
LLKIDIVTLFPDSFFGPFAESNIARAIENGKVEINCVDLREFTNDRRKTVDDKPYGGGPGMLMKIEPLFRAVESLKNEDSYVILMSPQGEPFKQKTAEKLLDKKHLIIICGHYEGVDERVRELLIDSEISIGDYVLTSGNLPAMVVVDAVTRLIPGVLGTDESSMSESFSDEGLLEYPQYTRPEEFRGMKVPDVLLSGNHGKIASWRHEESVKRTKRRRPDLQA